MRRLAIALLLLIGLIPAGVSDARISSAVNTRVAHPLGRVLGAITPHGLSPPGRAVPRAVPRAAGPQPPPPNTGSTCPAGANAAPFALCWFHGSVLHSNSVYTVFLAPSGASFPPGYINKVNAFFADQAAASGTLGNVYSTDTQYYDSAGNAGYQSSLAGTTTAAIAPDCVQLLPLGTQCISDTALTNKLDGVIAAQGWPRGLGPIYFIFLPQGSSVCTGTGGTPPCGYQVNGFCAYHSAFSSNGSTPTLYATELYAAVPGCDTGQTPNASSADAAINTASHEHNEVITDPLGDGWLDLQGNENGDKCASAYGQPLGGASGNYFNQVIGGGHYFLQEEFSNFSIQSANSPDNGCALTLPARPPTADFAATSSPVITGQPATFNATVTDPDTTIASVTWDFGEGGAGASGTTVSHVYTGAGPHTVTLVAVDALGLRTQVSHVIQVTAPDPHAAFRVSPTPALTRHPVTFDGSASSEPGGAIANWAWDFGDGSRGSGRVVSHSYRRSGPHTVTLLVSDPTGASNATTQTLSVRRGLLVSIGLVRGQTVRSVLSRGLRIRVHCLQRCRISARVAIGSLHRRTHSRSNALTVRVPSGAARALRTHRRLTLTVNVAAGGQRDSGSRTVRLPAR